jgi:hypothetical protein
MDDVNERGEPIIDDTPPSVVEKWPHSAGVK